MCRVRHAALGVVGLGVALPTAAQVASPATTTGLSQSLSGYGALQANRLAADPLTRTKGFTPYVELAERVDIGDNTDVRLFTEFTGGFDAFINRDRAEGTISLRLTDRLPVVGRDRNQLLVSGLGRGQYDLVRNRLFLDVSTYADVVATDYARGVAINQSALNRNLTQIYFFSGGPRLARDIGTLAHLDARYLPSYTIVDTRLSTGSGLTNGQPGSGQGAANGTGLTLQPLSNSFSQTGELSLSNQPRDGRFIVKLTGRIVAQEQSRLRQDFRSHVANLDLTYAITRPVSLVGTIGYEDYRSIEQQTKLTTTYLAGPFFLTPNLHANDLVFLNRPGAAGVLTLRNYFAFNSQPNLLRALPPGRNYVRNRSATTISRADPNLVLAPGPNTALGPVVISVLPTIDPKSGDVIGDPTLPRVPTYAQNGLVYDVGLHYAPSSRTLFELRVGQRFADVTVTGIVRQQFRSGLLVTGALTDGIETFGTILTRIVGGLPVSFVSNGYNSLSSGVQSVSSGVFRSRIGTFGAVLDRGLTSYGLEYTYNNRRYLDAGAATAPGTVDPQLSKREDITNTLTGSVSHHLDQSQTVAVDAFVGYYQLGLSRLTDDVYVGGTARYDYRFNRGIDVFGTVSLTQRFNGRSALVAQTPGSANGSSNSLFTTLVIGAQYRF